MCELERVGELSRENGVGKRGPKGGDRMTWASPKRPWGGGGGSGRGADCSPVWLQSAACVRSSRKGSP